MTSAQRPRPAWTAWRLLALAQWREQPARIAVTLLAIALGVALGTAVYLVNSAALNEFGLASKRLVGESDIIVRGPRDGFAEALYPELAHDPAVAVASPMLELEAAVPGRRETLKILGVDPFTAAALQPALMADVGGAIFELFRAHSIFLSQAAAEQLHAGRQQTLSVIVGSTPLSLEVIGLLSPDAYIQPLGIMDIASAQRAFDRVGRLNRVDLRLKAGTDVARFQSTLARRLPPGVLAVAPQIERDKAVTVTRAYRVNLNMLALVALWTGAFLVFSTQSLSVMRRRRSLAVLRALGVTRGQLQRALLGEGAALGAVGSVIGILLGWLLSTVMLRLLAGDLGNGQLRSSSGFVHAPAGALLAFFVVGTAVSALGAWLPSRNAARQHPARALKGGDGDFTVAARGSSYLGMAVLPGGALLAWLPPVAGLPIFGYLSVAALLFGAILLVPALTQRILHFAPTTRHVVMRTALAQMRDNVGISTLSLASIIVSFSLMVAMAIMVFSFRQSFSHWLGKLLPADLQLREPLGNDTAYWSAQTQARLTLVAGVARIEFRRTRPVLLDAARQPVTLIARNAGAAQAAAELPLMRSMPVPLTDRTEPVWISEAVADLYGYALGQHITLPLQGRNIAFTVAGIWRDYARAAGALVVTRPAYIRATGDDSATEASVWLDGRRTSAQVEADMRACFVRGDTLEITTSTAIRERSLEIFDRAFAITYALEAIAVFIGLTGVSFAASSTALARRSEFGMLRHLGMLRRQVVAMLASEGVLMSLLGVGYGLSLGVGLSLVLVYVINRQSFNWSIDLAVPYWQLALLSLTLIAAAAMTAIWSGRAAMSEEAIHAVREDW